ncbi:MAG: hypothetical protein JKZ03_08090 [Flavobacteriaceae bacterium]|nr:hypothetical protein [Flavobacteriaceae bacterium]PCJ26309.1 MAG: hypothetical protein COA97_05880 [Flavobacteriales bacterium]
MKIFLPITIIIGLITIAGCSKKDECTCVTTVSMTGQVDISTSVTRELEDGESCALSITNGAVGNQQTVVCEID